MALNVGALVHRVVIQQRATSDAVDASGAPYEDWSVLSEAWMSREAERGSERFTAGQTTASAVLRWTMRYLAAMDPDLVDVPKTRRLVYRNQVHDITEAEVIDRHNGIRLRTLVHSGVAA